MFFYLIGLVRVPRTFRAPMPLAARCIRRRFLSGKRWQCNSLASNNATQIALCVFFHDGKIQQYEAITLVVLYVVERTPLVRSSVLSAASAGWHRAPCALVRKRLHSHCTELCAM